MGLFEVGKFLIEADSNVFTKANFILMVGFIVFWIVVFVLLNRITKPSAPENPSDVESLPGTNSTSEPTKRALSA